jgi:serine/threonine protein kinase
LVVLREIKDGTDCSWPPPSPQMVTLQEVGELQGKRHALFEWVPGVTLREVLQALEVVGNPVPLGLVARVVIDAARAIEGIDPARAHGGLQDASLQIGFDGKISVLDFGAPRVSRFRPLGRVNYSADVFALGAVLHSALTGFKGEYASAPSTLPPPSSSHSEATPQLDEVVMRAISAQADSRQRDVGTFADELEAVVGPVLLSHDKLADVVQTLFKERIKLLQSLGGLVSTSPSAPNLEAELPMPGIPMGTQPGVGGPPVPPKPMVPWDSEPELGTAVSSEPTLPRVPSSDVVPRASSPSKPPMRVQSVNLTPAADDDEEQDERTAAVSRAELEAAQRAKSSDAVPRASTGSRPPLQVSRSPVAIGDEPAPGPTLSQRAPSPAATKDDEDSDTTNPRAVPRPIQAQDTSPRARRVEDEPDDTGRTPSAPPPQQNAVRNTTEAERLRAHGQERLRTPPLGTPKVEDDGLDALPPDDDVELRTEATAVKKRPMDPRMTAQTAQTLPPAGVTEESESPEPASGGGGALRWMIRLMAVLVLGLMVGVIYKVKKQQTEVPEDAVEEGTDDAGAEAASDEDAGAAAVALGALDDADGGEDDDDLDGGEDDDDADAGADEPVDAGAVAAADAGMRDAGAPVKKPVKKVIKKKKKKKRR